MLNYFSVYQNRESQEMFKISHERLNIHVYYLLAIYIKYLNFSEILPLRHFQASLWVIRSEMNKCAEGHQKSVSKVISTGIVKSSIVVKLAI